MGGADLCMVTIRTTFVDVYALADKLVEKVAVARLLLCFEEFKSI